MTVPEPLITSSPDRLSGTPVFAGTRVRVPEILTGRILEILSGLRKETGDESAEREGI